MALPMNTRQMKTALSTTSISGIPGQGFSVSSEILSRRDSWRGIFPTTSEMMRPASPYRSRFIWTSMSSPCSWRNS